jgi:hypothetical protein
MGDVEAICGRLFERRERFGIPCLTVRDTALRAVAPVVARLAGG